jgi:flagellar basal-body rod protein FlgB
MSLIFDRTMSIMQGGMAVRRHGQAVSAGNIANADTPGFQARRLDFGDTLQKARRLEQGALSQARLARIEAPTPDVLLSQDGNNVNLEDEIIGLSVNAVEYEALTGLMRRKLGMLRFAIDNS